MKLIRRLVVILLILSVRSLLIGQGGFQIHGGIINGLTANTTLTPEGTSHTGYRFGADVRFFEGNMYFLGGVHLAKHSWVGTTASEYFNPENGLTLWQPRFGLGFTVFQIDKLLRIRSKALLSGNVVRTLPKGDLPSGLSFYNDLYAGVDVGVGVDILFFTVDIEYQIGIDNAINELKDTKYNYLSLTVGIFL